MKYENWISLNWNRYSIEGKLSYCEEYVIPNEKNRRCFSYNKKWIWFCRKSSKSSLGVNPPPKSYQNFNRPTHIRFYIDIYSLWHQCRIIFLLKFRQLCDSIQTKCSDGNSIKCMVKSFSFLMELSVKDEEKFLYPFIFILIWNENTDISTNPIGSILPLNLLYVYK